MAKSRALVAAELRVTALEARIDVATEVFRNQKARIAELEAQLARPGRAAIERHGQRTVKRYPSTTGASA